MHANPHTESPRVVVIGGGVAGLSTAWHLAQHGAESVHVLERTGIAEASSGLSAGIFNRQTFDPHDLALRVASGEMFAELEQRTDFRITRCGYMRLARTEEQWQKVVETITEGAYPNTELISAERVQELVPGMNVDDVVGAMYGAQDGHMDGQELSNAYLQVGRELGVTFVPNCEVIAANYRDDEVVLETSQGEYRADIVVNAAGSWLAEVGELLQAPVPIDNQLHEIVMFHVPALEETPVPTVQTYFPGSGENALYIRPEGNGRFLVGLHSYESTSESAAPGTSTRQVNDEYLEVLAEAVIARFPTWDEANIESGWSGIYPLSPDGKFIIGPAGEHGRVITLGGLGGVGLTVSGAVGKIAAEWALYGESRTFDFAHEYMANRFERTN